MSDAAPLGLRDRLREKRRRERPALDATTQAKAAAEPTRVPTHLDLIREMANANGGVVRVSDVRRELIARNMTQGNPRHIYTDIGVAIRRSGLFEKCGVGTYCLRAAEAPGQGAGADEEDEGMSDDINLIPPKRRLGVNLHITSVQKGTMMPEPTQPPARAPEREIDVERLAKAATDARLPLLQAYNTKAAKLSSRGLTDDEWNVQYDAILTEGFLPVIRAVLDDIAAQGFVVTPAAAPPGPDEVVVRRDDLQFARDWMVRGLSEHGDLGEGWAQMYRIDTILDAAARPDAEPGTGEEGREG